MLEAFEKFMRPPKGMDLDFSQPKGAASLVPVDGISWEIFANPISLYIGGIAAVFLELTEPSVGSGVSTYSNFKQDTFGRLHRTGYAAMMTVFAPRQDAEKMIARVVKMHTQVKGTNYQGNEYFANDTRLLDWVQSTAIFGFTEAYHAYVRKLSTYEKDQAMIEGQASGRLYGAVDLPNSWREWEHLFAKTAPTLESNEVLLEFIEVMKTADILPKPFKGLQILMLKAAAEITPQPARNFEGIRQLKLNTAERALIRSLGLGTKWVPIKGLPPEQARKRMQV